MITKSNGLFVSEKVLNFMMDYDLDEDLGDVIVQAWSTNQEEGYSFWFINHGLRANVAHSELSNSIIVVFGATKDFNKSTYAPSDKLWNEGKKHFNIESEREVADYIFGSVMDATVKKEVEL